MWHFGFGFFYFNMGSSLLFPATSVTGVCWSRVQVKVPRFCVRASLDTNVSDMSVIAPKFLFPPEPEHYGGPKLKVSSIGAGHAGMSTAVELLDQGHEVDIYESRSFIGGKVGSFIDKHGNHIEMGLHIFFGCYNNLFRLMKKVNADKNLLTNDHSHTFVNKGGEIGGMNLISGFQSELPYMGFAHFCLQISLSFLPLLDSFLMYFASCIAQVQTYDKARNALALALSPVISFSDWFLSKGGTRTSIQRMWDPVAYALGFIDCDNISAWCMLTIFTLFATKTEASLLRMLKGSPDVYLSGPIRKHITDKGGRFHLRWGCREILYDKSANGETYVKGLAMSKATDKKVVQADAYVADLCMEGPTLSGRQASGYTCNAGEELVALRKQLAAFESHRTNGSSNYY
ncbi:hypothetical protein CUMW_220060 [Citrus unshiu]|uniref:Amine oxidase domain-containing protein n=1 Tax=Citrus unshiu TaxID=55188 RepID=A0A2H5QDK5_CITUN|nr:hypothetical protein CUMW_220060 [Citrus unshiu]